MLKTQTDRKSPCQDISFPHLWEQRKETAVQPLPAVLLSAEGPYSLLRALAINLFWLGVVAAVSAMMEAYFKAAVTLCTRVFCNFGQSINVV